MEYIIVAFKSRTESIKLSEILKENGVYNQIISTPKQAGVGCGLSVKVGKDRYYLINNILERKRFNSFIGIFAFKIAGGKRVIVQIK